MTGDWIIRSYLLLKINKSTLTPVDSFKGSENFLPHVNKFADQLINNKIENEIKTLRSLLSIPITIKNKKEPSPEHTSFISSRIQFKEIPETLPEHKRYKSNMNAYGKARQVHLKIINKEMLMRGDVTPKMIKIPSNPKLESELKHFFIKKKKSKVDEADPIDII